MAENSDKSFFAGIEEQMLTLWRKEDTLQKSLDNRKQAPVFSFYDGPPFANGQPHYGHILISTIKDVVARYKTMQGFYVGRRNGWDCHGLPIEQKIEKELGVNNRKEIMDYGLDKFNEACRESVFRYKGEFEWHFERVGRWVEADKAYATLDNDYIESIWWAFAEIYKKGFVYKDLRSAPYCPRCETTLSNFEVNQGYQEGTKDPSVYVKFKLKGSKASILGWTTTPWTLPANAALAILPDAQYVEIELKDGSERLILAQKRLEFIDEDYKVVAEYEGKDLVGKSYEPLFEVKGLEKLEGYENLYKVWPAEFVSIEDGTGVLHVSPFYGEDDLALSKKHSFPGLRDVNEEGKVQKGFGIDELAGKFFKGADKHIIARLTEEGKVYVAETIEHTYPFCWRCDTPLLYFAQENWYIATTKVKDKLLKNNQDINWVPKHVKDGRFGKWLEGVRDWAFARSRYWGAPLPIWITKDGEIEVIASVEELKKKALNPDKVKDLHRPYIDDIVIKTDSGKEAHRVPEVFDVWFESGSMPYAQNHYPFENKKLFQETYPADLIIEAIDQTRGWFYTLHVLSTLLFDKPAFKQVVVNGWIVAADGQKLSKKLKNYEPMDHVFNTYGADSLRLFLMNSPVVHGEDVRFNTQALKETQRNILLTLWNSYKFFQTYADIDKWKPDKKLTRPTSKHLMDEWILARLDQLITTVTKDMNAYRIDRATDQLQGFVDDLSNWYIRRSRRRFWKSEDDSDKKHAYQTLHYVLVRTVQVMAPWTPFISDYLWRELVGDMDLPKSVHLSDWPKSNKPDVGRLGQMDEARHYINEGLSQRAAAGVKVRQPLLSLELEGVIRITKGHKDIIADEVNVKEVIAKELTKKTGKESFAEVVKTPAGFVPAKVQLDTKLTKELEAEGIMRDTVRHIQNARKQADLEVDDRIELTLKTDDKATADAIKTFADTIKAETLAKSLDNTSERRHESFANVNGVKVQIGIDKA